MLMTILLAGLAGWAARPAETKIAETLAGFVGEQGLQSQADRRAAALLVCLIGAGLVLWILDARGGALVFSIGAALGYFFNDIREAILNRQR
ncbi:hypothetical protein [Thalassococcus lentus]|uniref:Uncharacterized protein n=1 Tax=Thalassococcus lentus TaxID=1210524 RepID=A0ABT4XQ93_9RHOB|nr:hypothetical protein [Thalassococcus lentus]MDA7424119.1 hypothetical protein [Thalassococcus lentus]